MPAGVADRLRVRRRIRRLTDQSGLRKAEISPPGGGPPPHQHLNEDETFFVIEGEYEFLVDGNWVKASAGDSCYRRRGTVHTFRNCGTTSGRILIFVQPGGFQNYLEEISPLSVPADLSKLIEISNRYGIAFPGISPQ